VKKAVLIPLAVVIALIAAGVIGVVLHELRTHPVADAGGPYLVDEVHNDIEQDRAIALDGRNSSDPDGFIELYSWTITNDPTGESSLTDINSATPVFHSPRNVNFETPVTINLSVTDNAGITATDTTTVIIKPYNEMPEIIAFSPTSTAPSVDEPNDLTFSIDASDEEDLSLSYLWSGDASGRQSSWIYYGSWDSNHANEGINVTVEVRDSGGKSDSVAWLLTVNDVNRAPTVNGRGPYTVDEDHGVQDMTVELSALASDPEGDSLNYEWMVTSGVAYSSLSDTDTLTPVFHAPPEVDSTTYVTLRIEVSDGYGGSSTDTVTVAINPYEELAHKYMPTLKFEDGKGATYFPVDCAFDGDFDSSNNEAHYNEVCNYPAKPAWVYIHEVEWKGVTYIEYWYYYAYNNYFNEHYNDWELMIVVLDSYDNPLKVRYGSHGYMRDCSLSEVQWIGTHPVAYIEEGSHAMDVDAGSFPGGNPLHSWEGAGYTANWHEFKNQHTFFGEWYSDSGSMSKMEAGGYSYRGYVTQEANDGWWPADFGSYVYTPWSQKAIWNNPTLDSY